MFPLFQPPPLIGVEVICIKIFITIFYISYTYRASVFTKSIPVPYFMQCGGVLFSSCEACLYHCMT